MSNRRALIVAPLYDGKWLPPLAGRPVLVERLTNCLREQGGYEVKALNGLIYPKTFREVLTGFFDSPGELLMYYYGHGCLGTAGLGYFATSDAAPFAEGVLMHEVTALTLRSPATEIVLIYDCCHAGAAAAVSSRTLDTLASELASSAGRDLLAACAAHQAGWEAANGAHQKLGAFSAHILDGLEGAALPRGSTKIRGTALAEYVTRQFREWNQDPIVHCKETGTRHCVITSGFLETEDLSGQKKGKDEARILGAPFKPSQLFVGRSAELDGLVDTLVAGDRPIAVSATVEGLGGIGKTELVLQLVHHPAILEAYNAILWLDGAGPLAPQWEKLAAEADIALPAERPKNFLKPLEKGLAKLGHVLIVLDNATDWSSVAEWIPVEFPLLVTTRTRDFGGNRFIHTELDVLSDEASLRFLKDMVPEIEGDMGLPKLVKELGGHALALELAGWNIKYLGLSPTDYIERLRKHTTDSDFALSATRYGNTVDGCLALTWNSLRHDASRTLWRRAALFAPTSAHRDLLRVSAGGSEEYREEMEEMLHYIEDYDQYDYPDFQYDHSTADVILRAPSLFDEAYAELRALHVLARVEGFNGERWAMHRIVRDFGRARLRKSEKMLHAMAFANWLRHPTLPIAPEIPHFVVAVLDSARDQQFFGGRVFAREISYRSRPLLDSRYFLKFIQEELNDPKALTLILEGLTDINEDVRIQAIRLLENIGPIPEVLEALQSSLDDPDRRVRQRAGATLAKHGGKRTVEILLKATRGPKVRARLTAVEALGLMGKKAHAALRTSLHSEDSLVQVEAALLLSEQGQKDGVPILLEKVQSGLGSQEDRTIEALGEARDFRSVGLLTNLLSDDRRRIRVIRALGKIGDAKAHERIAPFLTDDDDDVRCAAAEALATIGSEKGIESIVEALVNTKSGTRGRFPSVVLTIAKQREIALPVAVLVRFLGSQDWKVRMECAIQLGSAKAAESVEALIDALVDSDSDVRREAARALGMIGDIRAIDRLKEISKNDTNSGAKEAAKEALKKIGGK